MADLLFLLWRLRQLDVQCPGHRLHVLVAAAGEADADEAAADSDPPSGT